MKKTEALDFLEEIIEKHKQFYEAKVKKEKEGIAFCNNEKIHVFTGIHMLAAACGEELKREAFSAGEDDYAAYRYSFTYKGVELFQLSDVEQFPEVLWDE